MRERVSVYVGIGSNIAPERHVREALRALEARFGPIRRSRVYRTPAVGFNGDDFLNLVVGFETDEDVEAVADALREIEDAAGRRRGAERFAPRTLDLDLLLYGGAIMRRGRLQLPREEILEQAFVLGPLAELAPELIHPQLGRSLAALWAAFPGERKLSPVPFDGHP